MFNSTIPRSLKVAVAAGFISALALSPVALAAEQGKENLDASASKEITGEVVDMMCYVDHNAVGDKHGVWSGRAQRSIRKKPNQQLRLDKMLKPPSRTDLHGLVQLRSAELPDS